MVQTPAANERFGASGGMSRPTVCGDFESLSPVRAAVNPPPTPSRWDVNCKRWTAQRETDNKKENLMLNEIKRRTK